MAYCDRTFRSACDISALVWNSAAEKHAEPIPQAVSMYAVCARNVPLSLRMPRRAPHLRTIKHFAEAPFAKALNL